MYFRLQNHPLVLEWISATSFTFGINTNSCIKCTNICNVILCFSLKRQNYVYVGGWSIKSLVIYLLHRQTKNIERLNTDIYIRSEAPAEDLAILLIFTRGVIICFEFWYMDVIWKILSMHSLPRVNGHVFIMVNMWTISTNSLWRNFNEELGATHFSVMRSFYLNNPPTRKITVKLFR